MKLLVGRLAAVAAAAGGLCACEHTLPPVNVVTYDRISQVEAEVKRQISVYQGTVNDFDSTRIMT